MGMGCTRVAERVCAAVGLLAEAPTQFENAESVAQGGVLWALPALLATIHWKLAPLLPATSSGVV